MENLKFSYDLLMACITTISQLRLSQPSGILCKFLNFYLISHIETLPNDNIFENQANDEGERKKN